MSYHTKKQTFSDSLTKNVFFPTLTYRFARKRKPWEKQKHSFPHSRQESAVLRFHINSTKKEAPRPREQKYHEKHLKSIAKPLVFRLIPSRMNITDIVLLATAEGGMSWWQALILGIVEGLTEYLPVSSTGHLLVTEKFLGMNDGAAEKAFAVCIQGGAILAVLGLYRKRVADMIKGLLGKNPAGLKLFINIVIAFLPAVVIGLIFASKIKEYLFGIGPVIIAWVVGGMAMLIFATKRFNNKEKGHSLEELTPAKSLLIGTLQCVAMWPGTSRSLMTIIGGLAAGLTVAAAVEFSFLLGLITLGAATCYDAYKFGGQMLQEFGVMPLIIGTLASWLSAWIAVKWMVSYLQSHSLSLFGWYRIAIGLVVAVMLFLNII